MLLTVITKVSVRYQRKNKVEQRKDSQYFELEDLGLVKTLSLIKYATQSYHLISRQWFSWLQNGYYRNYSESQSVKIISK